MLKGLVLLYCFGFYITAIAQDSIAVSLIKKTPLKADRFAGVDDFGFQYYTGSYQVYKVKDSTEFSYASILQAEPGFIDLLNPLELLLFYKEMNQVVLLDNTLNEILKIDFNRTVPFKNLQHVSLAINNHFWILDAEKQQMELFNYRTRVSSKIGQPFDQVVIDVASNYNFCWVLTPDELLEYNSYGGLIRKISAPGFDAITQHHGIVILKRENRLFYLSKYGSAIIPIQIPDIQIKEFYLNDENLYIYDAEILHQFQLQTTKNN